MKKILLSLAMIAVVGVAVAGATGAFFSNLEKSTGNTFTAGGIDLKIDSDCHYYQLTGGESEEYVDVGCGEVGQNGVGVGQWAETDLKDGVHRFFNFSDIKPGDKGEDTISLHVYGNDAWGRILMNLTNDLDNSCTEPEEGTNSEACTVASPEGTTAGSGELLEAMLPGFKMWLDQGATPGFQNVDASGNPIDADAQESGVQKPDATEGDNVWQENEGSQWNLSASHSFSTNLSSAYTSAECTVVDGKTPLYTDRCHGLASDGRMVGSTTYYFGLNWSLPWSTGNEVQTDSLSGDITFEVEQHRNNPSPFDL